MAGWTFMPTNRVPVAALSIVTGTAVSGYPIENLNDAVPWHQARITPAAGSVTIQADLGSSPATTTDPSYLIAALGLANHNLDGAVITVKSNTAASYAGATTRLSAFTLQANMQNPHVLIPMTAYADRYWYLNITSAPNPTKIGVWGLGPTFDLGYPEEGEDFDTEILNNALRSGLGYTMDQGSRDPVTRKVLRFVDPDQLNYNSIYNRTKGAGAYYAYDFLMRHFRQARDRSVSAGGTVYTGESAGSGRPIFYHEGDSNGLSSAGRPAFYGRVSAKVQRNLELRRSEIEMTIEDQHPLAFDIAPGTY